MQERLPPRNVILCIHKNNGVMGNGSAASTHMLEYTPGYRIPSLTPGTGADGFGADAASCSPKGTSTFDEGVAEEEESHRSGLHSLASGPHIPW
jgi:hypothetical protein